MKETVFRNGHVGWHNSLKEIADATSKAKAAKTPILISAPTRGAGKTTVLELCSKHVSPDTHLCIDGDVLQAIGTLLFFGGRIDADTNVGLLGRGEIEFPNALKEYKSVWGLPESLKQRLISAKASEIQALYHSVNIRVENVWMTTAHPFWRPPKDGDWIQVVVTPPYEQYRSQLLARTKAEIAALSSPHQNVNGRNAESIDRKRRKGIPLSEHAYKRETALVIENSKAPRILTLVNDREAPENDKNILSLLKL